MKKRKNINKVSFKLAILLILLVGCENNKDIKYCYYIDYRNYIHKYIYISIDKDKAVKVQDLYGKLKDNSISEFRNECASQGLSSIRAKKKGEIIRYYPELGIAKVLFRFTNEELNAPARMDVRKRKYYVPMLLLHDTLPKIDTVQYIPEY